MQKPSGIATAALVVSIIALVTALVPVLGFVLGIIGLILAIISQSKDRKQKKWIAALTMSMVALIANIFVSVLLISAFSSLNLQWGGGSGGYGTKVQMIESAQKSFAAGETAQIGPYDVTVTSAQKGYVLPEADVATVQDILDRRQRLNAPDNYPDRYGYNLTDETGQYVLVTLNVKYNDERASYDELSMSTGNWVENLGESELNDMAPLIVSPDPELYRTATEMTAATKTAEGLTMTLLYRVPKSADAFTLKYDITIFTKVSLIVGTEGMPRGLYEYTIGIQ